MYQPTAARWFPALLTLLRIIALALTLVSASLSFAQADQSPSSVPALEQMGRQIVSIDWKKYTFAHIAELPTGEQVKLLEKVDENTQNAFAEYIEKQIESTRQVKVAIKKEIEATQQEILEADKRLQAKEQEGHEIDKRLQAKDQEILEKKKRLQAKEQEIAEGLLILEKNIRAVLGAGGKLPKGHRETLELVWKEGTPEQAAYFKSVLQNPNNFSK